MNGVAVRGDAGNFHLAVFVFEHGGLQDSARAALGGFAIGGFGIVHPQSDLANTITMQLDVLGDGALGLERRGENEADFILLEHVGRLIARAGFGSAIGHQAHAERSAIVIRGLLGIADVKLHEIRAVQREKIGCARLNGRFLD